MNANSGLSQLGAPEEILRGTLDAAEELFFVFGADGTFLHWNRAVVDVTGYADEELAEMTPESFVADSDEEHLEAAIAEVLDSGSASVELTLVTADGTRIPYEFRTVRVDGDEEEEAGIAGFGRALTQRRRAQYERRGILDRMTDAFFAVDAEWQITYVNDQAEPILAAAMGEERTSEEMVGFELWEALPELVDTEFEEKYREAIDTQETVQLEAHYDPLDTWFAVRAYPSQTGLSVYFRDITEQREQRSALESRERVLREIYEVTSDTDLTFSEQVDALLEIGCEVLDTSYGTLSRIDGEDYVFEAVCGLEGSIEEGETMSLSETNCERTAAEERTLVLGDIARDAPDLTDRSGYTGMGIACYLGGPVLVDGEVRGTFCFYDESPREGNFSEWERTLVEIMCQWVGYELTGQHTREQLERQNAQLEEFASIVSHDLRNPLTVLRGSLDAARDTGEDAHFERGARALDRMEALIEDVLTLARAGERLTEREPVDLSAVVEGCWDGVATADATLALDADLTVQADRSRLRQLLENLVRNAVEHSSTSPQSHASEDAVEHSSTSPQSHASEDAVEHSSTSPQSHASEDAVEHGSTSPQSHASEDAVEHGSTSPQSQAPEDAVEHGGGSVTVSVGDMDNGFYVADDGPGIPAEDREEVFDAGYSTADDGTGFGLNIVKQVADAHGWTVRVVEGSDGGARFEITGVTAV